MSVAIRSEYPLSLSVCSFGRIRPNIPEYQEVIYVTHCLFEEVTVLPSPKCVQLSKALIGTRQNIPLLTALISVVLLLAYVPWDVSIPLVSSVNRHLSEEFHTQALATPYIILGELNEVQYTE